MAGYKVPFARLLKCLSVFTNEQRDTLCHQLPSLHFTISLQLYLTQNSSNSVKRVVL